jgi:two-component system sensor histidine kinase QseC
MNSSVYGPSLQNRLTWILLAAVTLVWLGAAVLTWRDASHELDELLDSHLAQAAALLVAQQTHVDNDADDDVVEVPSLHKYAPAVAFQVFHKNVLAMASPNVGANPMAQHARGFATVRLSDGQDWRVFAARGDHRDVQVYVGERLASRSDIVMSVLRSMLLPLLVALPLLAILLWSSVRLALVPLRKFSTLLGERTPHTLTPVRIDGMPAEMQPVLSELNALLQRIAQSLEAERRFTADAAHELRTPIAAIRVQAQVALGAGDDDEQRRRALQNTLAGCDRATRLVEQLLTLARLDDQSTSALPTAEQVDLGAIARSVVTELAPGAVARSQALEFDAMPACQVPGNGVLIGMLVRNLVDNALRYSPSGARIQLAVLQDAQHVQLVVQDSGVGMREDDMQRLGERFFRVLGHSQPGSGMGWSIVKRITAATGASVRVQSSPQLGGLQVTVSWAHPAPVGIQTLKEAP